MPRPVWLMRLVLPCISCGARIDVAAHRLADRLMAEADAEDRRRRREALDQRQADAGLVRRAGAGREDDRLGRHRRDLVEGDLVVAVDDRIRPKLAEEVDEVVGKAVVVIDDEESHCPTLRFARVA